ncbi:hypothetical protein DMB44_03675 [Thermoplasma sp. Kam2015]|uniref:glycosyltransferase family 2 protein n=1 Tax=Thermoplasma sp. Kam2015 TaxID=2094122 RepID=UPI000D8DE6DC|nr:hypothetical protein [Thermoplasma sp. Kam2015]PYB68452.1 hypothetical protein DMB44_03675 [Thermoplasma sp. Kam2015]
MRIYNEVLVKSEASKTVNIVVPTPDMSSEIYKKARFRLSIASQVARESASFYLTTVESSGSEFNYSRSVNSGLEELEADYYLNINDDFLVYDDALLNSILMAESYRIGVLGALSFYPTGKIQHAGIGYMRSLSLAYLKYMALQNRAPFFMLKQYERHLKEGNLDFIVFYNSHIYKLPKKGLVTGAYHFISRDTIKSTGGYDENFRMGSEDIDFCLEAIKKGFKVAMTTVVKGIHYETYHGLNYSKLFGKDTERYFLSKWNKRLIESLLDRNGELYLD